MINCPKCDTPFEEKSKWGIKKFCSRSCANSRIHSNDTRDKIGNSLRGRETTRSSSRESKDAWREKLRATKLQQYLDTPFEDLGMENRRRRVFEEQHYRCNRCGIDNWLGEVLSLELEHKDGNNKNNARENLEGLCPNCHSLTKTWRGRNKGNMIMKGKVSDSDIESAYTECKTIRQALIKVGLTPKGGNYVRAKRILGV